MTDDDSSHQLEFGRRPARSGDLLCPHCRCVGVKRTSRPITDQHREIHYQCSNLHCGHSWRASLSYDWGITPSAIPDPTVTLPLRSLTRPQVMEVLWERDVSEANMFGPDEDAKPPGPSG